MGSSLNLADPPKLFLGIDPEEADVVVHITENSENELLARFRSAEISFEDKIPR